MDRIKKTSCKSCKSCLKKVKTMSPEEARLLLFFLLITVLEKKAGIPDKHHCKKTETGQKSCH